MQTEFDESLITGNEMVDNQHRELIEKANELMSGLESKIEKSKAVSMLHFLAEYTVFHFNSEEELQLSIDFPGYIEHKRQHEELIRVVSGLQYTLRTSGPTDEFVEAIQKQVVDWVFIHIKVYDKAMVSFMKTKK